MATYTLIRPTVEATQLTRESVEAHLFDNEPLPEGFQLRAADYHPVNRTFTLARFWCMTTDDDHVVCEIGEWRVTFPDGHIECQPSPYFEKTYKLAD